MKLAQNVHDNLSRYRYMRENDSEQATATNNFGMICSNFAIRSVNV